MKKILLMVFVSWFFKKKEFTEIFVSHIFFSVLLFVLILSRIRISAAQILCVEISALDQPLATNMSGAIKLAQIVLH